MIVLRGGWIFIDNRFMRYNRETGQILDISVANEEIKTRNRKLLANFEYNNIPITTDWTKV